MVDVADGSVAAIARASTLWIAVGSTASDGAGSLSLAVAVDRDGALVWGPLAEHGPGASRDARGVAAGTDDDAWIVGDEDGPMGVRAWAQRVASDGETLDRLAFDTLVDDRFVTAVDAAVPIAGGATDGGAWLHGLADPTWDRLVPAHELRALAGRDDGAVAALLADADGGLFVHVLAPGGALMSASPSALAGATTLALARDGAVLSAATIDGALVAARSDTAGTLVWSTTIPGGVAIAAVLEHDDGDVALVGTRGSEADAQPWIGRCDPAGSLRWQRTLADATGTRIVGATQHDDGGLVLAGTRGDRVWLAAVAP
ncbi:MAG TPA: hypothetical protein VFG69_03925 [Nannocystaceae bacterium]|nr:hypothetical protein [Nannocystaceae bacterium]